MDNAGLDFEKDFQASVHRHFAEDSALLDADGLFSLSPLSSPGSSRSPSPEPVVQNPSYVTTLPSASTNPLPVNHPVSHEKYDTDKAHNRKRGHTNRKKKRTARKMLKPGQLPGAQARASFKMKYVDVALSIHTSLKTEDLPAAANGFVANEGASGKRVYKVEELIGKGAKVPFKLVKWNGRTATGILDSCGRIIAVLAGRPDDPSWESVHLEAVELLEKTRPLLRLSKKSTRHRRGNFAALSYGISHGGGQTKPSNLKQAGGNEEHMSGVIRHKSFERISGFGSSVLATWYPEVHKLYEKSFNKVLENDPRLVRNYQSSVFASAAINFGPRTQCFKHTDSANLPCGLCAITSLGSFDPTRGGHLVLWQCGLVIEFPPGSTVLIPSAVISHSNTAIGPDERRYSFTQYSAGSLFRWAEHGCQLDEDYYAGLSEEEIEEDKRQDAERWKKGLSMLPKVVASRHSPGSSGLPTSDDGPGLDIGQEIRSL